MRITTQAPRSASITLDTNALRHNVSVARQACQLEADSQLLAVVKANAYGHGMLECCTAIRDIVDGWAVARISEGIALREAGFKETILIMNIGHDMASFERMVSHQLTPVLCSECHIKMILEYPQLIDTTRSLWVKVDTGMHRLGLSPTSFLALQKQLAEISDKPITLMTHLHSAERNERNSTQAQLASFIDCVTASKTTSVSLCNSAQLLFADHLLPDETLTQHWHRPGIMLYGADPLESPNTLSSTLQAVMHFTAPVIALRDVPAGDTVGYNATWQAKRPSRIATIAAGYADGYPRHAQNGTPVGFGKNTAPLIGRVSMDMITVDVTELPQVKLGDQASLWGDLPSANTVAQHANTIAYTLFTGIGSRVERHLK